MGRLNLGSGGPIKDGVTSEDDLPMVTVVIPMLNEMGAIAACLEQFAGQTYGTDLLDVVVVDGGSTDGSRELVEAYAVDHPWVRVVDNPARKAAAAFNVGVREARGDVLCLFSAHGVPAADYVARSVSVLEETGAAGVGGRYHHIGTDPSSRAIGLAMVSPFGMASPHRTVVERREVDTISHPAYRIEAMREVGPFDEGLERNSDYEFNHRMIQAGHRLVVDPEIESIYRPRPSLRALGRQFWWYGRWKERVARRHPDSIKVRHLVPPAAVAAAVTAPLWARGRFGRRAASAGAVAYGASVVVAVAQAGPRSSEASPLTLAAAFPVMHGAWGGGFIASFIEDTWKRGQHG